MNVWSLFSGVGGLDLGIERAGGTVVLQCESDPWRRKVLAKRFPGAHCFPDVAALRIEPKTGAARNGRVAAVSDGTGRIHTVAVPDLLIGGFPCQDVSVAGQRRGLAGDRTRLFFDATRILGAVRPRCVLLENVLGLLSSNGGRDFGVVLGTLADLGYGVAWRIVNSQFFGVPQRRRRVFVCGVDVDGRAGADLAGEILAVGTRCPRHPAARSQAREDDPPDSVAGTLGGRRGFTGDDIDRGGLTSLSGIRNGGPDDNDAQANRIVVAPALVKRYGKGADSDATDAMVVANIAEGVIVRRLMPVECERLQGFPDGWTDLGDTKDSPRYSALGDAVTVNVAEWLGASLADHVSRASGEAKIPRPPTADAESSQTIGGVS